MFLRKLNASDVINVANNKTPKAQTFLQPLLKRVHKIFKSCQPQHWFDGFMDDVTIDLKDIE